MDRLRSWGLFTCLLFSCQNVLSSEPCPSQAPFYVTANTGIFQGTFHTRYIDKTDVITQNIAETILQNGYSGGLGLGFSKRIGPNYFLGAEFSGGWTTSNATLQTGAATSAFTDKLAIENYMDLVAVPGIFFTQSLAGYLKVGVSRATITDILNVPKDVNYVMTIVNKHSTKDLTGFTLSIGLKKWLLPRLNVFAEYNYRDYGTVTYSNFQNFTATYSHSARTFGQAILLGLNYQFI